MYVKLGLSAEQSTWCSVHAENQERETPSYSSSGFVTETAGTSALLDPNKYTKFYDNIKINILNYTYLTSSKKNLTSSICFSFQMSGVEYDSLHLLSSGQEVWQIICGNVLHLCISLLFSYANFGKKMPNL